MILDAHHHFWEYSPGEYGWIDDSMDVLKRDFLPGHLAGLLQAAGVEGTVVVQARQTLEETGWLLRLASEYEFIRGVVGWVDLCSAELTRQLDEFSGDPRLVGVRHVIHDEEDDDYMLRPAFLKGIEKLSEYGLSYDLLLFPKHLTRATELAGMFPGQRFVVDHLAKPIIREGILDPWRGDLEALAERPNVWCKVSGLVTEADPGNRKYEDFLPYLDVVTEAFGTERLMLGSDWPVCTLASSYEEVLGIPRRYYSGCDPDTLEKIFSGNAIEFYNLPNP